MRSSDTRTFAMIAKVVSGHCNLRCDYCYYVEKNKILKQENYRMTDDVLEAYVEQNFQINGKDAIVEFAWHGGEPILAGIDFFRKAINLEKKHGRNRRVINTLQTNATLLTEDWCNFFSKNKFLLGVSIDGPEELHNTYRTGPAGGSFKKAMAGLEQLKKHRVRFNILTTVNSANSNHPNEVYEFIRQHCDYMQFLPVVERKEASFGIENGQDFAMPPGVNSLSTEIPVSNFSVMPKDYGNFLCGIFRLWKQLDFGKKHVQIFEITSGNMLGKPSNLCVHDALCGHSAIVEANGDVYACDRYAFSNYKLGNILETNLGILMEKNRNFGMHKTYGLPKECFLCKYIKLCFGGCPKDRFLLSKDGQKGKNYLCDGYKIFFEFFLKNMQL